MSFLRVCLAAFIQSPDITSTCLVLVISTLSFNFRHRVLIVLPMPAHTAVAFAVKLSAFAARVDDTSKLFCLVTFSHSTLMTTMMMMTIIASGEKILTAGRIAGDISLWKINVTLDYFCGQSMGTLVDSTQRNPEVIPSKVSLPVGDLDCISIVHWAHPSLHPKRHHDRFSRFCMDHGRYRQTDRPATPSAAIGLI